MKMLRGWYILGQSPYRVNRLALWLHHHFFQRRHFWVTLKRKRLEWTPGTWCFECGTVKGQRYACDTENRLRQKCEPMGDYPNCIEVLEALLFVSHPNVNDHKLCAWCEDQARQQLRVVT